MRPKAGQHLRCLLAHAAGIIPPIFLKTFVNLLKALVTILSEFLKTFIAILSVFLEARVHLFDHGLEKIGLMFQGFFNPHS